MGQQQLLLVILVTIIVGIATVVALNVFNTSADQANRDAVRQDILTASANAQGYFKRPTMLDGGGNSFEELSIDRLGMPGVVEGDRVINENGEYQIEGEPAEEEFTIVGEPSGDSDPITGRIHRDDDNGGWDIEWTSEESSEGE